MPKKIAGFMAVISVLTLVVMGVANRADEFTAADLKHWQNEYMSVVETGRGLWVSPDLGTNGVAMEAYIHYERRGVPLAPGKH